MNIKKQGVNGKVAETEILELMYGEAEVKSDRKYSTRVLTT
jgi:hypothetical protein